eukprot:11677424-Heterocapsa_arctica.AAC.1
MNVSRKSQHVRAWKHATANAGRIISTQTYIEYTALVMQLSMWPRYKQRTVHMAVATHEQEHGVGTNVLPLPND